MITRAPRRTVRMLRGLRGFGDYTPENCSPMDVACVQRNAAASAAWQRQQANDLAQTLSDNCFANADLNKGAVNYDQLVASCQAQVPTQQPGYVTPLQAAYQTLTAPTEVTQLRDFGLNPVDLLPTGYGVVNETFPPAPPPAPPPPVPPRPVVVTPKASTPAAPGATTPQGQTVINSSGAPGGSNTVLALPTVGGFDLSSIPWWGWAGAAAVALFALGGKK